MFEDQHFRFRWEAGKRKVLFVRSQVSHGALPFCPVVDTSKLLRPVWIRFEVLMSVVHRIQERWEKAVTDGRDLVRLEDVKLPIDRHHEHIHAANLLNRILPERTVIAEMHNKQASDLDQPDGVALAEFLPPRFRVFPGISDHCNVANLMGARLAQHRSIRSPRNRPPHRFTAIVVVAWVRNQDSVRTDVRREIIFQPNAACVWTNENLLARGRGYAETGMGDVLNGYCAILLGRVLSANVAGRQCKDHECCEQKARWFFWSVPHCNGGGSTFSVSEGSQSPLPRECNPGAIALTRSFHAVGWADYSSPS